MVPGAAGLHDPRQRFTGANRMVAGSRSCSVPKSSRVNAITSKCPHLRRYPFGSRKRKIQRYVAIRPITRGVARLPDRETAAKKVPLEASTLSLAELPRQEGSPMYHHPPWRIAATRAPPAMRGSPIARLPCQRFETLRQPKQPN
jgi:hypothetical protein